MAACLLFTKGLPPQNVVGGAQAQFSPVEPQSAFDTAVPSLPTLRLVKPEQPQGQKEAHLAQKDGTLLENAVALPPQAETRPPQSGGEPVLPQEELANPTDAAQAEAQGSALTNLLHWPALATVSAGSSAGGGAGAAESSGRNEGAPETEDGAIFTYPKRNEEAPSVQAKEEEALRLYHELGTYARVAEQMGFKSDRTPSNLVRRALARQNAQAQLGRDRDSRSRGSTQRN